MLRDDLAVTMGPVSFGDLRPHVARDAVIVVDAKLDILDVGVAIAKDDKPSVEAWIASGRLKKPSKDDLERWSRVQGAGFVAVIVAPFVLVREDRSASPS